MPVDDKDKPFIRDVIADFLSKKQFQTGEICGIKMKNTEDDVKSLNSKLWTIIFLNITLLGTIAFIGFR